LQPVASALLAEVDPSIKRLVELRDNGKAEATRLRASESLIDLYLRVRSEVDVLPRIAALEAAVGERGRA
jgi:hypothetical protein